MDNVCKLEMPVSHAKAEKKKKKRVFRFQYANLLGYFQVICCYLIFYLSVILYCSCENFIV